MVLMAQLRPLAADDGAIAIFLESGSRSNVPGSYMHIFIVKGMVSIS
jgi:hypothetical protein